MQYTLLIAMEGLDVHGPQEAGLGIVVQGSTTTVGSV
jgi:hypothetical protein